MRQKVLNAYFHTMIHPFGKTRISDGDIEAYWVKGDLHITATRNGKDYVIPLGNIINMQLEVPADEPKKSRSTKTRSPKTNRANKAVVQK